VSCQLQTHGFKSSHSLLRSSFHSRRSCLRIWVLGFAVARWPGLVQNDRAGLWLVRDACTRSAAIAMMGRGQHGIVGRSRSGAP
jgi:hypothetical protein